MALIMCVTPVLFAGCDDLGLEGSTGGLEGGITGAVDSAFASFFDGFKVVYSDSQIGNNVELDRIQSVFYDDNILGVLSSKYGSGKKLEENEPFFPDAIRQTIIADASGNAVLVEPEDASDKTKYWNWTLNPNDSGVPIVEIINAFFNPNNTYDHEQFIDEFLSNYYSSKYPSLSDYYSDPIQIVLYEIMLGFEELTTFKAGIETKKVPNSFASIGGIICDYYQDAFTIRVNTSFNAALVNKIIYQSKWKEYYTDPDGQRKDFDDAKGEEIHENTHVTAYLDSLKQQYYSTATYHGLTKADADRLIDYILNEVIGEEVVKYDYNELKKITVDGEEVNYRNYVETVANLIYKQVYDGSSEYKYTYKTKDGKVYKGEDGKEITYTYYTAGAEKGDAAARPASYLRDYESEMFFESSNSLAGVEGATAFENSPLSEYQSVVIMPAKDIGLSGIIFQIFTPKANFNMEMTISVRYWAYDKESGEGRLFTWNIEPLDFYHQYPHSPACTGKSCDEQEYVEGKGYLYYANEEIEGYWTDFTVPLETDAVDEDLIIVPEGPNKLKRIELPKFENSEGLKPTGEGVTSTNGITEVDLGKGDYYYKVIPSQTGYGGVTVLDEKRIEFSFFEVVFDIKKDPTNANANYDFKLAVLTPY